MAGKKNKNSNIIVLMVLALLYLLIFIYALIALTISEPILGIINPRTEDVIIMILAFLAIIKTIGDIVAIEH